jgi:hypothetical protein
MNGSRTVGAEHGRQQEGSARRPAGARAGAAEVVSPAPRDDWLAAWRADPEALPTQQPRWTDAAVAAGRGADASRMYVMADGRRVILPAVRRPARGPTTVEASMPAHWGFGGLVAAGGVGPDDVRLVLDDLASRRIARQSIRPNPLLGELYRRHAPARSQSVARRAHVLDLRSGIDVVWKGFADSRRRAVRKAERSGVEVEEDATGRLLPEFFALLEHSEERWARQQHEPAWLARWRARFRDTLPKWQAISRHLDGGCRQWVARHDGRPVASIIVLFGVNAHYTRGAMDKDRAGPLRANDLLMWHAIQAGAALGAGTFHLGESGESRSLAEYKERFGARPVDYPELRIERLPITRADGIARGAVKRVIGFREP